MFGFRFIFVPNHYNPLTSVPRIPIIVPKPPWCAWCISPCCIPLIFHSLEELPLCSVVFNLTYFQSKITPHPSVAWFLYHITITRMASHLAGRMPSIRTTHPHSGLHWKGPILLQTWNGEKAKRETCLLSGESHAAGR